MQVCTIVSLCGCVGTGVHSSANRARRDGRVLHELFAQTQRAAAPRVTWVMWRDPNGRMLCTRLACASPCAARERRQEGSEQHGLKRVAHAAPAAIPSQM